MKIKTSTFEILLFLFRVAALFVITMPGLYVHDHMVRIVMAILLAASWRDGDK